MPGLAQMLPDDWFRLGDADKSAADGLADQDPGPFAVVGNDRVRPARPAALAELPIRSGVSICCGRVGARRRRGGAGGLADPHLLC